MTRANAVLAWTMAESDLQASVIALAKAHGWLWYHAHLPIRDQAGFPDLVLLHPRWHRLIFAELKTEKGRVRPEQDTWVRALDDLYGPSASTVQVYVWRPSHWLAGDIAHVLAGGA